MPFEKLSIRIYGSVLFFVHVDPDIWPLDKSHPDYKFFTLDGCGVYLTAYMIYLTAFICNASGSPRPPFDILIQKLVCIKNYDQTRQKSSAIVSIDIPSGWHVEGGGGAEGIKPDMLVCSWGTPQLHIIALWVLFRKFDVYLHVHVHCFICDEHCWRKLATFQVSLTAPKLCAKKFFGPHHFLGGRFVPPSIADKYKLRLPPYPGTSMCVRIGRPAQVDISALRENYISPEFLEEQVEADPFDQVQII